ncbi:MAG: tripartite tricarboxylate transporter permease [Halanaerobiales bacterium]|nr:tripartite tricarboxylate transporter permease [Halanaerobiales bacterium]
MISFTIILYNLVGVIIGFIMGSMPGLTVTMTMTLIVSLTFGFGMETALAFIVGAFAGGIAGGSLSAIALNIPGTAASVATTFDGHPLKNRGEAATALGVALFASTIGGLMSIVFLAIIGPIIGDLALSFGSQEYLFLTLWGLSLIAFLSKGDFIKGIISACLGLFVGTIGMDPITGAMRLTFGSDMLMGGVHFVVAMIGLFGMKEVLVNLDRKADFSVSKDNFKFSKLLPKFNDIYKSTLKPILWCGPIGSIIGLIPGTGGDIGSLVGYGFTKQIMKNPSRPFGEGAYEGVAAPEMANHSAMGGAYTTMLTLGIPGDSVTAVILGSFYLHGLQPGPTFMITERKYFYLIIALLGIGTIFTYLVGLLGSNAMLRVLSIPRWVLLPFIAILCVIGSYALQNNLNHVYMMIGFGVLGYLFDKAKFPVSPIILGIILGPIVERSFRQALINTGSVSSLLMSFVTRPITLIIIILIVGSFIFQSSIFGTVLEEK